VIDFMNPSRELDCLVAEKCLGYEWYSFIGVACLFAPNEIQGEAWPGSSWEKGLRKGAEKDIEGRTFTYGGRAGQYDVNGHGRFFIPKFSEDFDQAMKLHAALRPYKFTCSSRETKGNHSFQIPKTDEERHYPFWIRKARKVIWRCTFGRGVARASNPATAICKAALLFVGDTVIPAYVRQKEQKLG
jgi:hypothetical protein